MNKLRNFIKHHHKVGPEVFKAMSLKMACLLSSKVKLQHKIRLSSECLRVRRVIHFHWLSF